MIGAAIAGFIFARNRRLVEIFPKGWRELWNEWEIRGLVLISLSFQIVLMVLGNRRKYVTGNWISIILWLAYSSANTMVTASLGIISNEGDKNDDPSNRKDMILAFWASFLILHLGGTHTITAYSLEDNELWLRNAFTPLLQLLLAIYIILKSWMNTPLNFLAIPLFIVGIVKNGERLWVQRSASIERFQASMLPHPDPGPSYTKFMDEYLSKTAEGYNVSIEAVVEDSSKVLRYSPRAVPNDIVPDGAILRDGIYFFNIFKKLFANQILSFQDVKISQSFFHDNDMNSEKAFKMIEVELGLMYDILYTKTALSYTWLANFLRLVSLSFIIFAFVAFMLIDKHAYVVVDLNITYFLLVGAIALEIYEILVILPSDQMMLWLSNHNNSLVDFAYKAISHLQYCLQWSSLIACKKRWSNTMGSYNLISFCIKDKPTKCVEIQKFLFIHELLEKHRYQYFGVVSEDLKSLIFEQVMKKSSDALNIRVSKQLCAQRGDQILKDMGCFEDIGWSVEVEFDQSILLWHIATDLCYSNDLNKDANMVENRNCKSSKSIADYMLYLLVMRPFMLPNGIGLIRFQDTCAEAKEFFQERRHILKERGRACDALLQVNTDVAPSEVKGDKCKSVLFDACRLAQYIIKLQWPNERKWEMVSYVWVEMLSHAASQCQWLNHAKLLTQGGELLTHVWLLMAHLSITEQFQISQGHARVKVVVEQ
ncbi:hypothetical protein HS088_TW16G00356 [Tripterygium wilfordii]|uniref:DUF4220 domain-containing protein n=1 Tax=Tripterygium wilfordii TaxID=458696 RepID=A0A7J7CIM9_TRIWF|nr:uncharacterized protein LOC119981110 isoform X1 [Tripterygium wilfordii]XP_038680042.1 uncharacterized protein LOC119981110 isoform X1 [Tripterygium wilfordii]XP_038680043.1 uncharacterized protein LOC119981110 isoform X1 [Tripterygium wilfordii]XP_038680044.1 uncharacterized protein LOC119981110 isoform X1 [Tripterygium wilfordii]XP_038680045.1 uncharacterized protein LOC119981110 isoform X1 [Tripterygium wilfordii]XP_038680046.1 uncharacterized protein LOC119981110 isoform X1 [Tripterygiu